MPRRSILSQDEAPLVDLAPMIDCVFILLIFFIVTTRFVEEQGLEVNKPDAAATAEVSENENVVLTVTAENTVLFGDEEINLGDVARRVRSGLAEPATPVVVRAHEKARHGLFVSVWDAARRGGAETLTFSTVD